MASNWTIAASQLIKIKNKDIFELRNLKDSCSFHKTYAFLPRPQICFPRERSILVYCAAQIKLNVLNSLDHNWKAAADENNNNNNNNSVGY